MAPSDALPEGISAAPLTEADLEGAVALAAEAGWNQIAADWRLFMTLGQPIGLKRADGRLIATASTLPYGGRFGWISMVLVTAAERRKGLATWLLRHCIDSLKAQALTPGLDATPAGRAVYLGLGFRDCWGMTRLVCPAAPSPDVPAPPGVTIRPLAEADRAALAAYDRPIFGADRTRLLASLAERLPQAAFVAERQGRIAGFVTGRNGRVMTQLGPVLAEEEGIARALVARGLAALAGSRVTIDLADRHAGLAQWLAGLGFAAERPLTRMILERDTAFDDPARLFAVAGPELG
ncbi:MAG: GNAT family N-acetyltransferase [Candidatus Eiseniibacteriota bacterium]